MKRFLICRAENLKKIILKEVSLPINKEKIPEYFFLEKLSVELNQEISPAQRSCKIQNQLMWFQIVRK
jgi:hypothetical protein